MKRILCYGDSNTWGAIPETGKRYSRDIRWTGIMADILGKEYEIIEAGLAGRTTVFTDPFNPIMNGLEYLPMILMQSAPLDLVIISLGTNDLKFTNAFQSARGIGKLVDTCKRANWTMDGACPVFNEGAKILVVSPIAVHPRLASINPYTNFPASAPEESLKYANFVKYFADLYGAEYFDASLVAVPSDIDGLHMMPESHLKLGKELANKVKAILR